MQRVGQRVDLGAELVGFTSLGQRRDPELTFTARPVTRARGNHDRVGAVARQGVLTRPPRRPPWQCVHVLPGPLRAQAGLLLGGRGAAQRIRSGPGTAFARSSAVRTSRAGPRPRHRARLRPPPPRSAGPPARPNTAPAQRRGAGFELGELLDGLGASRFESPRRCLISCWNSSSAAQVPCRAGPGARRSPKSPRRIH